MLLMQEQVSAQAFIRLNQPTREQNNVSSPQQFLVGQTCQGCKLWLNDDSIHVYPTGAFAIRQVLERGKNALLLTAEDTTGNTYTKQVVYYFAPVPPPKVTASFSIEYLTIYPQGSLQLSEGDTLRIKMKAFPGCQARWINNLPLHELPASKSNGVPGYYEGSYVVQPADSMLNGRIRVVLQDSEGNTTAKESSSHYAFFKNDLPFTGRTIDNMTYLVSSPRGDRLGPDKIGYLDEGVQLRIVGRQGDYYKVRLSDRQTAFVPEPLVDTATLPEQAPVSIVSEAHAWGDEDYDYVSIALADKLPYLSTQEVQPGRIIVDVYGAYIDQGLQAPLEDTREVRQVSWQQPEPGVARMVISLQHAFPWGYQLYYDNNFLTVKIRRQPPNLSLSNLTIGVDAGHGGSNVGAMGPTGVYEKQLSLTLSMLLKTALEKEGATVLTTRTYDQFVGNEDRLQNYRRSDPDLLLSIHLNSSVNPIDIKGTATYYKHPFCQPLARAIYNRMQETGLKGFGCNGNFNFILNNPTEFPDVLVETLFLSNPEDEMKVLDEQFRQLMADKIVQGVKDFLLEAGAVMAPVREAGQ